MPDEHDEWWPLGGFETAKRGSPVDGGNYSGSKGWSAHGTLATGDAVTQISLSAVFDVSEDYTVQFDVGPSRGGGVEAGPGIAIATITASVEGNDVTRIVTVASGTSVTLPCQAMKIVIVDETPTSVPAGLEYDVSVQIARGTRGNVQQPPVDVAIALPDGTSSPFLVAPGTVVDVPIPLDSGVTNVYVQVGKSPLAAFPLVVPIPDGTINVQHFNSAGGPASSLYNPRDFQWIPIFPGADTIAIFNNSAGTTFSVAVFFGIDG